MAPSLYLRDRCVSFTLRKPWSVSKRASSEHMDETIGRNRRTNERNGDQQHSDQSPNFSPAAFRQQYANCRHRCGDLNHRSDAGSSEAILCGGEYRVQEHALSARPRGTLLLPAHVLPRQFISVCLMQRNKRAQTFGRQEIHRGSLLLLIPLRLAGRQETQPPFDLMSTD